MKKQTVVATPNTPAAAPNSTNTTYLVTGATGFVGNNLVKELERRGHNVIALVRDEGKAEEALAGTRAKRVFGDILNKDAINEMFESVPQGHKAIFVHTASVVYLGSNKKALENMRRVNIEGTQNVINECKAQKCRLVYVSSVHAITEPKHRALTTEIKDFNPKKVVGHYAKTKAAASALVMNAIHNEGLDAVLVHPAGITGPGDYSNTHMTQMCNAFLRGEIPAGVKGGYDFVDVRDVAIGIVGAAERGTAGDCFLLTNTYISVRDLLNILAKLSHKKPIKFCLTRGFVVMTLPAVALLNALTHKRPLFTRYSLYTLGSNSNFSHKFASEKLGYTPRSIEESLRDTLEEIKFKEQLLKEQQKAEAEAAKKAQAEATAIEQKGETK